MADRPFARIDTPRGPVSVFSDAPRERPRWVMALAHGAGTRADHPTMVRLGEALAGDGFAVFRFNFPYTEAGRKPPDRAPVLLDVWEAMWEWFIARPEAADVPRIAAGRSMGGRMASLAASDLDADGAPREGAAKSRTAKVPTGGDTAGGAEVSPNPARIAPDGLVLFAYPLHPPGRPERLRAAHLAGIAAPMLFVSGTRDAMAPPENLNPVLSKLGNRATMYRIEAADHGFKAPKRTGRTEDAIAAEAAEAAARWAAAVLGAGK